MRLFNFIFGKSNVCKKQNKVKKEVKNIVWEYRYTTFFFLELDEEYYKAWNVYRIIKQSYFNFRDKTHGDKELNKDINFLLGDTKNTNVKGMKKRITTAKSTLPRLEVTKEQLKVLGIV